MFYKLYRYDLEKDEIALDPSCHLDFLKKSIGRDSDGDFAVYLKQKSVLMYVREFAGGFTGLIGKHSTEREVTRYIEESDEAKQSMAVDDDYPHTPFICVPENLMIACVDGAITAKSAVARLHAVVAHHTGCMVSATPVRQIPDLASIFANFHVTEVDYEIVPVNPHTGDLGISLDTSKKMDHVERLVGRAIAAEGDSLQLNGGFVSAVQDLQQSGHCRVGFTGATDEGIEVRLGKPDRKSYFQKEPGTGTPPELRVRINERLEYPFSSEHLAKITEIMKVFSVT
ncbi:MAG: hypothetical protein ACFCUW_04455 [Kiloniellaceae bacterium]